MNVSSLSGGASAYSPNLNRTTDTLPNSTSAGLTPDWSDTLDLSTEGMEMSEELMPETLQAKSEGADRFQMTNVWKTRTSVANYLQLGFSLVSDDKLLFFKMFDTSIESTEAQLEARMTTLLDTSGIELGEDERFDIHIDEDGVISVTLPEGEGSEERAEEIADLLNSDEGLAHQMRRLKSLRNSRDSILGLEPVGRSRKFGTSQLPDMSTRQVLAEDFLQREFELSLEDFSGKSEKNQQMAEYQEWLGENESNEAIGEEIDVALKSLDDPEVGLTADYSFGGDGLLLDLEETSDAKIDQNLRDLFSGDGLADHPEGGVENVADAMVAYNSTALEEDKITNFSLVVNEQGAIKVEGEFASGDRLGTAKKMIESWMTPTFKALVEVTTDAILKKHAVEHGDVDEYEHQVELMVDIVTGITAEVQSEEADRAALEDIGKATIEVAASLSGYVQEKFREEHDEMGEDQFDTIFSEPVDIYIDEEGTLSIDEATCENVQYLQMIKETVSILNDLLVESDEAVESLKQDRLPEELRPVLNLLLQIQQDMGRIHDRSLCSVRFPIGR